MATKDIAIYESGNGGQISVVKDDLVLNEVLYNQFYLALFGGNIEANTTGNEIETEERFDYWANSLIFENQPNKQYNSNTERVLNEVVLNSNGRLKIIESVNSDLSYLSSVVNFTTDVSLDTYNRVNILINFTEKSNKQQKALQLVFDRAKNEIVIKRII
jgi:hypothetical protein